MIIGILFTTIIAWIPTDGNQAAYIGSHTAYPSAGIQEARTDYFKKLVTLPDTSASAGKLQWDGFGKGNFWVALITFL